MRTCSARWAAGGWYLKWRSDWAEQGPNTLKRHPAGLDENLGWPQHGIKHGMIDERHSLVMLAWHVMSFQFRTD